MPLPLAMTLAGSIPLLICIILWLFQKNSFNPILGRNLLRCSIFFYLVPVQLVYHLLPESWINFLYYRNKETTLEPMYLYFDHKLQIPLGDGVLLIPYWILAILLVGACILLCLSLYYVFRYKYDFKKIVKTSSRPEEADESDFSRILTNPSVEVPFTIGFVRSYIVFPTSEIEEPHREMLFKHEFYHAKNKDTLMKLLCMIVICIHWYNPCAWLLFVFYGIVSEYVCDYQVTRLYSQEEKREYAQLLVEYSSEKAPLASVWKNNFSTTHATIKRRITYIMKSNKKQLWLIGAVTVFTIFLSSASVLAYRPVENTDWISKPTDSEWMAVVPDEISTSEFFDYEDDLDFSVADVIFVTEDGTQIPLDLPEWLYPECAHTYADGKLYQNHQITNTGACSVDKYEATVCTSCTTLKFKNFMFTISYSQCPHKVKNN